MTMTVECKYLSSAHAFLIRIDAPGLNFRETVEPERFRVFVESFELASLQENVVSQVRACLMAEYAAYQSSLRSN